MTAFGSGNSTKDLARGFKISTLEPISSVPYTLDGASTNSQETDNNSIHRAKNYSLGENP
jgi:hypothetical protein